MFDPTSLLEEQQAYYRARAPEYDDWWLRRGRYDRGDAANAAWFGEISALERLVDGAAPFGACLELACGTGLWTQHLARLSSSVVAVDGSAEVLSLARGRLAAASPVTFEQADLFSWSPPAAAFDTCFFAFWLSHVPEERFAAFCSTVAGALRPGGRAVVIDSLLTERSTAADHVPPAAGSDVMTRRLDDGREFRIVKRFFAPSSLTARMSSLGWSVDAVTTGEFFLFAVLEQEPSG